MRAKPARAASRLVSRITLGAAAAAVVVVSAPGTASVATTGDITPMLDCYTYNSSASTYTVVLGYTSTFNGTVKIAQGATDNYASPSKYNTSLPTSFSSGVHHAAFTVTVSAYEVNSGASWFLKGHQLNYLAQASASGVCSPGTTLPADGNGTGLAVGLVGAGAVGAFALHRLRRRTAASVPTGA